MRWEVDWTGLDGFGSWMEIRMVVSEKLYLCRSSGLRKVSISCLKVFLRLLVICSYFCRLKGYVEMVHTRVRLAMTRHLIVKSYDRLYGGSSYW